MAANEQADARDNAGSPREQGNDDRSTSGGRGHGRDHRRSGRGGRGGRGNQARSGGNGPKKKFEGGTKDLGTNVFQLYAESRDRKQFERTKDAIEHYVRLNLLKGNDIVPTIRDLKESKIKEPAELNEADKTNEVKKRIFEKKIDAFVKREEKMEDNLQTLYSIIWNQCSKQVKMQIKSAKDYKTKCKKCDPLWLLKTVKGICYSFQDQKNKFIAIDRAKTGAIYTYVQGPETSLADFQKEFLNMIDVLQHYGGSFGDDPGLFREALRAHPGRTSTEAKNAAKDEAIAMSFLLRAIWRINSPSATINTPTTWRMRTPS